MNLHVSTQRATDDLLTRANLRLRVGEHVIDVGALRIVTRPDQPRLTSKAVAVLIELVRHVGKTVTRDQLLDRVWTGRFPTPDVLTQAIKELRRALADDSKPPRYIETIPKVGYRLIAPVLVLDGPDGGIFVESGSSQAIGNGIEQDGEYATDAAREAAPVAPASATARHWLPSVGALALVAAGVALAVYFTRERAPAAAPVASAWQAIDARALTSDTGPELRPHISPDGTRIAFGLIEPGGQFDRIVVRSVEPSQLIRLTAGTNQHEAQPAWSPDGTRIAFERLGQKGCTMYVASSLGGDEREVGTCVDYNVNYYDWTPDGRSLITAERKEGAVGELALMTLNLDTGQKEFLDYEREVDDQDLEPHFSPDGRWIAFRRGIAPYSDLFITSATGGATRKVTNISGRIRGHTWSRDGSALVFASNFAGPMALYAVDIESGRTHPLGVSPAEYPHSAPGSDNIVYEITRTQNTLASISLEPDAQPPRLLAPSTGSDYVATLSPSGDRVVYVSDRTGQYQLWLYDWASNVASPLTDRADTAVFAPRWSADGKTVMAVQHNAEGRELVEIDVASRRQRMLSKPGENVLFGMYGLEPDSHLVVIGTSGKDNKLILVQHADTPGESRTVIETGVAYAQLDTPARSLYYTPTAGRGLMRYDFDTRTKTFISPKVNSISMNSWRVVDGRIWFVSPEELKLSIMYELDPASGEVREVSRIHAGLADLNFSVMPDRKSIVFSPVGTQDTDVGMARLVRTDTR
jgi:Tol biopolymer transport system component/DNA-binding winged helix-turn-helix (wHTH) protein